VKLPRLGGVGVRAVPRLCNEYPGICPTTEEKSRKILSQGNRRALGWSASSTIRLVDLTIAGDGLDQPAGPCRPWLSRQATGSTVDHRKNLPNCRTTGFLTSTNFESKLSVSVLMWSANSGTSRSSCICLLLTYQGSPVARRRRLHCVTYILRTWERAEDFHAWHAYSIMGRLGCLYSRTAFLTERSLFLFRKGPSVPKLWAVLFLNRSMWDDQVSPVSRVTPR